MCYADNSSTSVGLPNNPYPGTAAAQLASGSVAQPMGLGAENTNAMIDRMNDAAVQQGWVHRLVRALNIRMQDLPLGPSVSLVRITFGLTRDLSRASST